jgi:hypothetical protein
MLLLGLSGLMDAFNAAVPGSIVRGIQLAVGLALAKKVRWNTFASGSCSTARCTYEVLHCVAASCLVTGQLR